MFFSARKEQDRIDKGRRTEFDQVDEQPSEEEGSEDEESKEDVGVGMGAFTKEFNEHIEKEEIKEQRRPKLNDSEDEDGEVDYNTPNLLTRGQILKLLKKRKESIEITNPTGRLIVGTVGYPNVGKSSVINVLLGSKQVGVASLPGKTKHFQTHNLGLDLQLCDCPGLVFPSFANSKAEMMTCGILPIDTMRDYIGPLQLVLSRIGKDVLETQYKIELPPRDSSMYTVSTFCQLYAAKRGWFSGRNLPNEFLAAKALIKEYTTGKLLFCETRPDYDAEVHGVIIQSGFNMDLTKKPVASA